ncbi:MAG: PLP-dependent aminotransferase family protein [Myxococcales bacterium]|nr:PLP-dependent aminotransferase family protein [Myxococcales bacterium]
MTRAPYLHVRFQPSGSRRRVSADDIVRTLVAEAAAGHLPPGSRLPPVRALEHELGISKNTVQAAYDELCARGVLVSRERDGVFVADGPGRREMARAGAAEAGPPAPKTPPAARLREIPLRQNRPPTGDALRLDMVFVDPDLLPRERIAECFRSVLHVPGLHRFYDAQGYAPLREAIARRLRARGMDVVADDVVTTTGSQQALDAVCRALATRRVACENPVYPYATALFRSLGAELVGLRLDPFEPLPLEEWGRVLAAARPELFYTITSFHNPTGRSCSSHELTGILALASDLDFALLEDDWGSDMLSQGEYRPSLRAFGGRNVLYANSFTKKLLPSLRIGFVAGDERSVPAIIAAKRVATLGNPTLIEAALAELLERGYYDTHLTAMQQALDARYTRCLELLDERMPAGVRWTTPGGGPLLWLEVPRSVDLDALAARLAERQVVVAPTPLAFQGEPHLHGLPLGYAFLDSERLARALEILGAELGRALGSAAAGALA